MGRILAIDPGEKRLGLALSDTEQLIATPFRVIPAEGLRRTVEAVKAIVMEEEVAKIVIGMPIGLAGNRGPSAEKAAQLAEALREATGLAVLEWDERLTTVGASRAMHEGGVDARKQRGKVDMIAATLILQAYLEAGGGKG